MTTDQQLKDMMAALVAQVDRTTAQVDRTTAQVDRTTKSLEKTDEKLQRMWIYVWNFIENDGKVIEEYFFSALDKSNALHWEEYNYFSHWEKHSLAKWREQEFDIIGYNGNKITAIEVKKIVHKKDVKKLIENQLPFLKELMANNILYQNHRIYWWIAGFKINNDAEEYARKHWIIVLTKNSEDNIEELTLHDKIKAF